jgi:hypothetical protein
MTSLQCAVKSSARIYGLKIRTNSHVSFYFLLFNYKLQAVLLVYHTMHKGEFEILPNGSVLILFFSFYVLFRLFALPYPLLALLCLPVLCCTCLHSLIYISHVTTLFTLEKSSGLLPLHFQSLRAPCSSSLAFPTSLHPHMALAL